MEFTEANNGSSARTVVFNARKKKVAALATKNTHVIGASRYWVITKGDRGLVKCSSRNKFPMGKGL